MKNFTKKLALLLVFAMVLGVVAPGKVAKAAASDYEIRIDFESLIFEVYNKTKKEYVNEYEYTQYVGDSAPTADNIKAIKDKDWVSVDTALYARYADLSWFNKKKASYIVVRVVENNATDYTYIVSDKIDAQEDALKVLYTNKNEATATDKAPGYTSAQAVGSSSTGYFVFYRGKKGAFTVITPTAISFRVDGSYYYYKVKDTTAAGGGVVHDYFDQYLSQTKGAKGATFYFVQAKKYSVDKEGWPVKEAKYKYAAQKNAPTVKLDITHVIPLKAGQEYRIVDTASKQKSAWVSVDTAHGTTTNGKVKVGKILLEDLLVATGSGVTTLPTNVAAFAENGKLTGEALATGNVKIQVRTAATDKVAVASKIYSVVVTETAIAAKASAAALNVTTGVDVGITYKVGYDATKGITIKNNNTTADYEFCLTTSGASVTATDKWTALKANKSVDVKAANLKNKAGEAYTNIHVRKVGDKKNGILSSKAYSFALSGLTLTEQEITPTTGTGAAISGITGAYYTVTTAGAVTVNLPKDVASGAAVEEKSIEVTVSGVTNPGTLKWASKGSNNKYTVPVPTYANNKVTFKFAVKKDTTSGDSGEYKCAVEGLNFTFKVVIAQ